jgi:hypothetical protein
MDIVEFFQLSSGKWFSHRTSHHLATNQSEGGKSDLQIELLPNTDPDVIRLCEQSNLDARTALCGARVTWNGTMDGTSEKRVGTTLLVPIATADNPNEGKLLRATGAEPSPGAHCYRLGTDEALTLISESETLYAEERIWFASPNLRLRTSTLKRDGGLSVASFCSEIRMGGAKPASPEKTTAKAN